ncbi:helix-turn-helix domain protein [Escherichia coli P0302293.9]|nr:helix-turn-helix domain protein [Escherichia coli P0302308.1]EMX15146.1 helix-turn-helix domain protein [Escherichia coli P0302293.2]ENC94925.1 helix-turn-helix domain protein [Escherichia coli P0302308.11]ENC95150.1 helix-turn-helix domain protein [Escherichia coli P0302308.10]END17484.1 helix-turn-helix domain protein [Escherichia coli P0302308.2]END18349.1 helix-turn-helix domain protein [Escherichia coli P0302308.4]END23102.1 helix-turn-helix domain protein [Escherichia coli P0302308.5
MLNLAEELSNVSKACKIMGVSRDTFYRYRELADEGGVDALINRSRRLLTLRTVPMRQLNRLLLITPSLAEYKY